MMSTNQEFNYSKSGSWVSSDGTASTRSHLAKATGQMLFASDLKLPGMLIGMALRSPYPHCEIKEINIEPALRIPGVHAVLTADDIPGENIVGKTRADQEFLVTERARSVMDALAIVAAEDEQTARKALAAIELDLAELPAVFDPKSALDPAAPKVHSEGNRLLDFEICHNNAAGGMLESEIILEATFRYPWIEHAFIETESVVAAPDEDVITVWLGVHNIYGEREILAKSFGWPEDRFRVILVPAGGSFGGKDDNIIPTWAALLAHKTGRPVRFWLSREDSICGHSKRHSQIIFHKLGARMDGMLISAEIEILSDTGAYAHWGEGILRFASLQATGPYRMPNAYVHTQLVYTNNIVAGAMRGWGSIGVEFAMESQMNKLADELGIHPLKLRYDNALRDGDITISGARVPPGNHFRETLMHAAVKEGIDLEGGVK